MNKSEEIKEEKDILDKLNIKLSIIERIRNLSILKISSIDKPYLTELSENGEYMIRAKYALNRLNNPKSVDERMGELLDKFSGTNTTNIGYNVQQDRDILTRLISSGEFMVRAKLELQILNSKEKLKELTKAKVITQQNTKPTSNRNWNPETGNRGRVIRETTKLGVARGGSLRKTKKRYK